MISISILMLISNSFQTNQKFIFGSELQLKNSNYELTQFNSKKSREKNMIFETSNKHDIYQLKEQEILSDFVSKKISPDRSIQQKVLDFSETFFPDGRWLSVRKMRGPLQIEGRWFIKNNEICVTSENSEVKCRAVWKSVSSRHFYFSDIENYPDEKILRVSVD